MTKKFNQGRASNVPPQLQHVRIFFEQKGFTGINADEFFKYYQSQKWKTIRGCPIRNWKTAANNWMTSLKKQQCTEISFKISIRVPTII